MQSNPIQVYKQNKKSTLAMLAAKKKMNTCTLVPLISAI